MPSIRVIENISNKCYVSVMSDGLDAIGVNEMPYFFSCAKNMLHIREVDFLRNIAYAREHNHDCSIIDNMTIIGAWIENGLQNSFGMMVCDGHCARGDKISQLAAKNFSPSFDKWIYHDYIINQLKITCKDESDSASLKRFVAALFKRFELRQITADEVKVLEDIKNDLATASRSEKASVVFDKVSDFIGQSAIKFSQVKEYISHEFIKPPVPSAAPSS